MVNRVVEDRNRITAGGITAGIDFGLRVAAQLRGEDYARFLELALEYDPQPPYGTGTPEKAPPAVEKMSRSAFDPLRAAQFATRLWKLERSGYRNKQAGRAVGAVAKPRRGAQSGA